MNREAKNNFELGVYIFGNTRRTADVAYGSTAQAIRTVTVSDRARYEVLHNFDGCYNNPRR